MRYRRVFDFFNFRSIAGIGISIVLLWLTVYSSGLTWAQLHPDSTAVYYLAAAIFVFIITIVVHAMRTRLLWVKDGMSFSTIQSYGSLVIGNFYNCLLPGNLGEGVRAWHFHRKNKVLLTRSLAAVATEKWVDAQLFLPVIILLFYLKPSAQWHYLYSLFAGMFVFITAANFLLLLMAYDKKSARLLWFLLPVKKIRHSLYRVFCHLLNHLKGMYKTGWWWVYGLVGYLMFVLNLLQYFFILKAVHITVPEIQFYSVYLIGCSMIIIATVPSAPSSVGVLHYGIYTTLCSLTVVYNTPLTAALKQQYALASVYLHLSYFLPEILLGLVFLWRERKLLFGVKIELPD